MAMKNNKGEQRHSAWSAGDHDRQGRAAEVEADIGERGCPQRRGGLVGLVDDGHDACEPNGPARQAPAERPEVEESEDRVTDDVGAFAQAVINVEDSVRPQAGEQPVNEPLGVPGGASLTAESEDDEGPGDRRRPISE